jgi:hypothetical protein
MFRLVPKLLLGHLFSSKLCFLSAWRKAKRRGISPAVHSGPMHVSRI